MNAHEVLATHKISIKSIRRANGTVDKYYSIQFTYPQGTKRQFTGNSEDEVKNKVFQFFNVPLITFRELHEKLLLDTKSEHLKKTSIKRFLEALGSKPAVAVTSDDILKIGKQVLAEGFKSSTANSQILKISWMYDYGIDKGLVDINPAKDIKRFRKQEVAFERNYLTDRQIYEFLLKCKKRSKYMFAVFFICGIPLKKLLPLQWKDIDFVNHTISITKQMKSRTSNEIVELERTERETIEEPKMAFDFLQMQLKRQSASLRIPEETLMKSDRLIMGYIQSCDKCSWRFTKFGYKAAEIFHTSAVYAFKAECDLPSVASIVGYGKAMKMFRYPDNFDLFERKKKKSVNDFFDDLRKDTSC